MNNTRRKRIAACVTKLDEVREELEDILMEEQEAFDNLPEGIQDSDRGQAFSDAIENLEEAIGEIDSVVSPLELI